MSSIPAFNVALAREQQRQNDVNFLDAYNLPQLPDDKGDVYDRLVEAERRFGPDRTKDSYANGTARFDNELLIVGGDRALFTAEHATGRWRAAKDDQHERAYQAADHGTGGLGMVCAEDTGAAFIAPLGRQTMDANDDISHPLKELARPFITHPETHSAVSLHRMFLGRVATPANMRGYNLIFGVGPNPSPETQDAVDKMLSIAKTYDLRAGVNQPVLRYEADANTPKQNEAGGFQTITFAASKPGTTRSFAERTAAEASKPLIAVQVEISQANLVLPEDHPRNPGLAAQQIGTYLAYMFFKESSSILTGREI